jgi:hypothetical protein
MYEYFLIYEYYKDKKAKRSGVPYMNHIDEGLIILNKINASEDAKKGFLPPSNIARRCNIRREYSASKGLCTQCGNPLHGVPECR